MESKTAVLKEQFLKIYLAETSSDDIFKWVSNTLESYSAQYREENERLINQVTEWARMFEDEQKRADNLQVKVKALEADLAALRGQKLDVKQNADQRFCGCKSGEDCNADCIVPAWIAKRVIAARDAHIKGDHTEVYHQLYSIASPEFESLEPWKDLEEMAQTQTKEQK